MSLGNHLYNARKNKGLSQEAVAEKPVLRIASPCA